MLEATIEIIKAGLKSDPTVLPADRTRILAMLRNGTTPPKTDATNTMEPRLVRRREAAQRLGCSLRLIDRLAHDGVLQKRRLPGRVRAAGFLETDLDALIVNGTAPTTPATL